MAEERFEQRDRESLETLAGNRQRGAKQKAAVRIEDLAALADMPILTSRTVAAAPTQAEHNALVADVRELYTRVAIVADVLRKRVNAP